MNQLKISLNKGPFHAQKYNKGPVKPLKGTGSNILFQKMPLALLLVVPVPLAMYPGQRY